MTSKDLEGHASWMTSLNQRLPTGSTYKIEIAFNGNGVLESTKDPLLIKYEQPEYLSTYFFIKPDNTGSSFWPLNYSSNWNQSALMTDSLYSYIASPEIEQYFTLSHTFTHLALNNVSRSDVINEIFYNQLIASSNFLGLVDRDSFSPKSLITPAITGLLNGDALSAFVEKGFTRCFFL